MDGCAGELFNSDWLSGCERFWRVVAGDGTICGQRYFKISCDYLAGDATRARVAATENFGIAWHDFGGRAKNE